MFIQLEFYVFLLIVLVVYYAIPVKYRWIVLLIGSQVFYFFVCAEGYGIFVCTIVVCYTSGIILTKMRNRLFRKIIGGVIFIVLLPLFMVKTENAIFNIVPIRNFFLYTSNDSVHRGCLPR